MQLEVRISPGSSLRIAFVFLICLGSLKAVCQTAPPPALTSAQVVQRLVEHNQDRANRLRSYISRRHYHLEYHGFPHSAEASMDVEVTYSAPSKSFRIISQSGSQLLIDHVLKKLLTSEQEASAEQNRNALTPANYDFSLVNTVSEDGRTLFVLRVLPRTRSKFLYRGKIWVDSQDYAVVRIAAEPAENPSFWIRNTDIQHQYSKLGDFWLPRKNTTVTKVRFGGTATLIIDYQSYKLGAAEQDVQTANPGEPSVIGELN